MKRFNVTINKIFPETFCVGACPLSHGNRYLGFIDVEIRFNDTIERLTIGFYRSSGTNAGKIKGDWYPIIGVKTSHGEFTEFTNFQNHILNASVGSSDKGWYVKSIFFMKPIVDKSLGFPGYSYTSLGPELKSIAEKLKELFESNSYIDYDVINGELFNRTLFSSLIHEGSSKNQKLLHDIYVKSIFEEIVDRY